MGLFNCIRIEGGAGITHDAEGKPRGELMFYPAVPGHGHFTRQMEHMTGGRVDLMQRLIELCTVAKRHKVKVILSSWYFLHTYWFTDKSVTSELLGLPPEQRFIRFALDTSTPSVNPESMPRNAQVWTFHSYYLWDVYKVFEQNLLARDVDLTDPASYAPIRRFLRRDLVPFQAILDSRKGRPPIEPGWYRRIWLYRNLEPNAMPELVTGGTGAALLAGEGLGCLDGLPEFSMFASC